MSLLQFLKADLVNRESVKQSTPLPVEIRDSAGTAVDVAGQIGATNETAYAGSGSKGLNGILKGIYNLLTGAVSVTYADRSITSATGSSQTLIEANTSRKALVIVNPKTGTTDWTIDPMGGTAASGTMPGITLSPGDSWGPVPAPTNKITAIGTSTSKLIVLEG